MRCNRIVLALLVCALVVVASAVYASVAGRRNTAIGATALALYELGRGRMSTGVLAGAGAYVAWDRYEKGRRKNKKHCRDAYLQGYRDGVRRSYREWCSSGRSRR